MPVTLRQRLDCHYCGRRSKRTPGKKRGGKFQCENCLAVNYFDEHGEVADVPVEDVVPAQQWAHPVQDDPLADSLAARDSLFCSVCLKNQHVYNYTLSQYLPDPEHPDYDRLEEGLPEYKKVLEQRYPQCCAKCEPKVRAQLHQATYNARSDHLRRVLEKSRQRRISNSWGWRRLVVNAAGLGYFVSLAVQVLWHLYGSQVSFVSFVEIIPPAECLRRLPVRSQCLDTTEPLVGLSLALGLLCVWWNPKWQHKLLNRDGWLVGLHRYYIAQFVLLGFRLSAWTMLHHLPISMPAKAMLHACCAVALIVLTGWSVSSIVKVRLAPPVNWHQDPAPLLTSKQFIPPTDPRPLDTQRPQDRPFSVESLAGPSRPTYEIWNPPTPPPDGTESMDWTPSQPAFKPQIKPVRYMASDPATFHGNLPALNTRGVYKNANQAQIGREAIGLPPGFFDKPTAAALPPRQNTGASEAMAQPTFFGLRKESDTGLEGIFDSVFSLQDGSSGGRPPSSIRSKRPAQGFSAHDDIFEVPYARRGVLSPTVFSGVSCVFLLGGLTAWTFEAALHPKTFQLAYQLVLISTIIPMGHFVKIVRDGVLGRLFTVISYAFEVGALIGLAMLREKVGQLYLDLWDKGAIAVFGLLLVQEFLTLTKSFAPLNPQRRTTPQRPASDKPGSKSHGRQPVRELTMAETSRAIMPGLLRRVSDDSLGSDHSDSVMTEPNPWETPAVQNNRFQYVEPVRPIPMTAPRGDPNVFRSINQPRRHNNRWNSSSESGQGRPAYVPGLGRDRPAFGNDDGLSRNENSGITSLFGRNLNLTSPGTNAGLQPRRRF